MNKRARFNLFKATSQLKSHKKMYKAKKQWVVAPIAALVPLAMAGAVKANNVHAASTDQPTKTVTNANAGPSNVKSVQPNNGQPAQQFKQLNAGQSATGRSTTPTQGLPQNTDNARVDNQNSQSQDRTVNQNHDQSTDNINNRQASDNTQSVNNNNNGQSSSNVQSANKNVDQNQDRGQSQVQGQNQGQNKVNGPGQQAQNNFQSNQSGQNGQSDQNNNQSQNGQNINLNKAQNKSFNNQHASDKYDFSHAVKASNTDLNSDIVMNVIKNAMLPNKSQISQKTNKRHSLTLWHETAPSEPMDPNLATDAEAVQYITPSDKRIFLNIINEMKPLANDTATVPLDTRLQDASNAFGQLGQVTDNNALSKFGNDEQSDFTDNMLQYGDMNNPSERVNPGSDEDIKWGKDYADVQALGDISHSAWNTTTPPVPTDTDTVKFFDVGSYNTVGSYSTTGQQGSTISDVMEHLPSGYNIDEANNPYGVNLTYDGSTHTVDVDAAPKTDTINYEDSDGDNHGSTTVSGPGGSTQTVTGEGLDPQYKMDDDGSEDVDIDGQSHVVNVELNNVHETIRYINQAGKVVGYYPITGVKGVVKTLHRGTLSPHYSLDDPKITDGAVDVEPGTHDVSVMGNYTTDGVNYVYNGGSVGNTQVKDGYGSDYPIQQSDLSSLNGDYRLANDGSQEFTIDGTNHNVNVVPVGDTDTIDYQYDGNNISTEQMHGNKGSQGTADGQGLNSNYVMGSENNTFTFNGGNHIIEVYPKTESENISYVDPNGNNRGTTSISGPYGSQQTVTGQGLNPSYEPSNDGSQTFKIDGQSHNVNVKPAGITDTIDYQFNGNTISSVPVKGDKSSQGTADGKGLNSNYTVDPNANKTFTFNGGTHDVNVDPKVETENITYDDGNGQPQGTTQVSGQYGSNQTVTGQNLNPNYELAGDGSQGFKIDGKSHTVNVKPVPETDTVNYVSNGNNEGSTSISGNKGNSESVSGQGISPHYHLTNQNNSITLNGGSHSISVSPDTVTDMVNYVYNNTPEGSNNISGNYDSNATVTKDNQGGLNTDYQLANDGSQNFKMNAGSHTVNVVPIGDTDTIDYQYNGTNISTPQVQGDKGAQGTADGTGLNSNYNIAQGADTTFTYDNGTHTVSVVPKTETETINYTDDGGTNQGTTSVNGQYGTPQTVSGAGLNDNYQLADDGSQNFKIGDGSNNTHTVNVKAIPETDTIDYTANGKDVGSTTLSGNKGQKETANGTGINNHYHLKEDGSETITLNGGSHTVDAQPNHESEPVDYVYNGQNEGNTVISGDYGTNVATPSQGINAGYQLASSDGSEVPITGSSQNVNVEPSTEDVPVKFYDQNGDYITNGTATGKTGDTLDLNGSHDNNDLPSLPDGYHWVSQSADHNNAMTYNVRGSNNPELDLYLQGDHEDVNTPIHVDEPNGTTSDQTVTLSGNVGDDGTIGPNAWNGNQVPKGYTLDHGINTDDAGNAGFHLQPDNKFNWKNGIPTIAYKADPESATINYYNQDNQKVGSQILHESMNYDYQFGDGGSNLQLPNGYALNNGSDNDYKFTDAPNQQMAVHVKGTSNGSNDTVNVDYVDQAGNKVSSVPMNGNVGDTAVPSKNVPQGYTPDDSKGNQDSYEYQYNDPQHAVFHVLGNQVSYPTQITVQGDDMPDSTRSITLSGRAGDKASVDPSTITAPSGYSLSTKDSSNLDSGKITARLTPNKFNWTNGEPSIYFTANPQTLTVHYVDQNGNPTQSGATQQIQGSTNKTVNFDKGRNVLNVPVDYNYDSSVNGNPNSYKFTDGSDQSITVHVKGVTGSMTIDYVDQNGRPAGSYVDNNGTGDSVDLNAHIPSGYSAGNNPSSSATHNGGTQTVTYHVNGNIVPQGTSVAGSGYPSHVDNAPDGHNNLPAAGHRIGDIISADPNNNVPQGYSFDNGGSKGLNDGKVSGKLVQGPNGPEIQWNNANNQTPTVHYSANPQTATVHYLNSNGDSVGTQTISGTTNGSYDFKNGSSLNIPDGYRYSNQANAYKFTPGSNQSVDVSVTPEIEKIPVKFYNQNGQFITGGTAVGRTGNNLDLNGSDQNNNLPTMPDGYHWVANSAGHANQTSYSVKDANNPELDLYLQGNHEDVNAKAHVNEPNGTTADQTVTLSGNVGDTNSVGPNAWNGGKAPIGYQAIKGSNTDDDGNAEFTLNPNGGYTWNNGIPTFNYSADPETATVEYTNQDGQSVGNQTIKGTMNQTYQFGKNGAGLNIPGGYGYDSDDSDNPSNYQFTNDPNQKVSVSVKGTATEANDTVTVHYVDQDGNDVAAPYFNGNVGDYIKPSDHVPQGYTADTSKGDTDSYEFQYDDPQKATFHIIGDQASYNPQIGTSGDNMNNGTHSVPLNGRVGDTVSVDPGTIQAPDGYSLSPKDSTGLTNGKLVAKITPNGYQWTNGKPSIYFTANPQKATVSYVDQNGNPTQSGAKQVIKGVTNQSVNFDSGKNALNVPTGYVYDTKANANPNSYKFNADGSQGIVVHVRGINANMTVNYMDQNGNRAGSYVDNNGAGDTVDLNAHIPAGYTADTSKNKSTTAVHSGSTQTVSYYVDGVSIPQGTPVQNNVYGINPDNAPKQQKHLNADGHHIGDIITSDPNNDVPQGYSPDIPGSKGLVDGKVNGKVVQGPNGPAIKWQGDNGETPSVHYKANPQKATVHYQDANGDTVGTQTINGTTNSTYTFNNGSSLAIPSGYHYADTTGSYKFTPDANQSLNVSVTPTTENIPVKFYDQNGKFITDGTAVGKTGDNLDLNGADQDNNLPALPDGYHWVSGRDNHTNPTSYNVKEANNPELDLYLQGDHEDVTAKAHVNEPNGTTADQDVTLSGNIGDTGSVGPNAWNNGNVPEGYSVTKGNNTDPDNRASFDLQPDGKYDWKNGIPTFNYTANPESATVQYSNQDGQNVGTQTIKGTMNQTYQFGNDGASLNIPGGYEYDTDNSNNPSDYQFNNDPNQKVIVNVKGASTKANDTVTVRYVDQAGNNVATSDFNGNVGDYIKPSDHVPQGYTADVSKGDTDSYEYQYNSPQKSTFHIIGNQVSYNPQVGTNGDNANAGTHSIPLKGRVGDTVSVDPGTVEAPAGYSYSPKDSTGLNNGKLTAKLGPNGYHWTNGKPSIYYTANPQSVEIHYVDQNGNPTQTGATQTVKGSTNKSISFDGGRNILDVPVGYTYDTNSRSNPNTYKFTSGNGQNITVRVKGINADMTIDYLDQNGNRAGSYTDDGGTGDTVNLNAHVPAGYTADTSKNKSATAVHSGSTQTVSYYVTGVTVPEGTPVQNDAYNLDPDNAPRQKESVNVAGHHIGDTVNADPSAIIPQGYSPDIPGSKGLVDGKISGRIVQGPNGPAIKWQGDNGETPTVHYKADPQSATVHYQDAKGNPIGTQTISGTTNGTFGFNGGAGLNIPNGYHFDDSNNGYKFTPDSGQSVNVKVVPNSNVAGHPQPSLPGQSGISGDNVPVWPSYNPSNMHPNTSNGQVPDGYTPGLVPSHDDAHHLIPGYIPNNNVPDNYGPGFVPNRKGGYTPGYVPKGYRQPGFVPGLMPNGKGQDVPAYIPGGDKRPNGYVNGLVPDPNGSGNDVPGELPGGKNLPANYKPAIVPDATTGQDTPGYVPDGANGSKLPAGYSPGVVTDPSNGNKVPGYVPNGTHGTKVPNGYRPAIVPDPVDGQDTPGFVPGGKNLPNGYVPAVVPDESKGGQPSNGYVPNNPLPAGYKPAIVTNPDSGRQQPGYVPDGTNGTKLPAGYSPGFVTDPKSGNKVPGYVPNGTNGTKVPDGYKPAVVPDPVNGKDVPGFVPSGKDLPNGYKPAIVPDESKNGQPSSGYVPTNPVPSNYKPAIVPDAATGKSVPGYVPDGTNGSQVPKGYSPAVVNDPKTGNKVPGYVPNGTNGTQVPNGYKPAMVPDPVSGKDTPGFVPGGKNLPDGYRPAVVPDESKGGQPSSGYVPTSPVPSDYKPAVVTNPDNGQQQAGYVPDGANGTKLPSGYAPGIVTDPKTGDEVPGYVDSSNLPSGYTPGIVPDSVSGKDEPGFVPSGSQLPQGYVPAEVPNKDGKDVPGYAPAQWTKNNGYVRHSMPDPTNPTKTVDGFVPNRAPFVRNDAAIAASEASSEASKYASEVASAEHNAPQNMSAAASAQSAKDAASAQSAKAGTNPASEQANANGSSAAGQGSNASQGADASQQASLSNTIKSLEQSNADASIANPDAGMNNAANAGSQALSSMAMNSQEKSQLASMYANSGINGAGYPGANGNGFNPFSPEMGNGAGYPFSDNGAGAGYTPNGTAGNGAGIGYPSSNGINGIGGNGTGYPAGNGVNGTGANGAGVPAGYGSNGTMNNGVGTAIHNGTNGNGNNAGLFNDDGYYDGFSANGSGNNGAMNAGNSAGNGADANGAGNMNANGINDSNAENAGANVGNANGMSTNGTGAANGMNGNGTGINGSGNTGANGINANGNGAVGTNVNGAVGVNGNGTGANGANTANGSASVNNGANANTGANGMNESGISQSTGNGNVNANGIAEGQEFVPVQNIDSYSELGSINGTVAGNGTGANGESASIKRTRNSKRSAMNSIKPAYRYSLLAKSGLVSYGKNGRVYTITPKMHLSLTVGRGRKVRTSHGSYYQYDVMIHGRRGHIIVGRHALADAYYRSARVSWKRPVRYVKVLHGDYLYNSPHFSTKRRVRGLRKGALVPVFSIKHVGRYNVTRFYVGRGRYITANKHFVKFVK